MPAVYKKTFYVAFASIVFISAILQGILWLPLPILISLFSILIAAFVFVMIKSATLLFNAVKCPAFTKMALNASILGIFLCATPIYYLCYKSYFNNLEMPLVTLTNGVKTIKFQGMIHVGPFDFYRKVLANTEQARVSGYTIFLEGVESTTRREFWTQKTLFKGESPSRLYSNISETIGLHSQKKIIKNGLLARSYPASYVVVDVSTQDIFEEYLRLWRTSPKFRTSMPKHEARRSSHTDRTIEQIKNWQDRGGFLRKYLSKKMFQGIYAVKFSKVKQDLLNANNTNLESSGLQALILNFRDEILAKRIAASTSSKIYIVYGSAHLPGVIAKLKKADPKWKVHKIETTKLVLPR